MRSILIILFFSLYFHSVSGFGSKNRPIYTIDFELVGTNIIVPVKVNNSTPLKFIFDTGIRHTIITELFNSDTIELKYLREVQLNGLGSGDPIITYISTHNRVNINSLQVDTITVYALKENIFQLSKHLGTTINGMIGYDLIKNHVIKIDYSRKKIFFYDPLNYKIPKRYRKVPLSVINQKPYIKSSVTLDGREQEVRLLVDTGAELALWLVDSNFKHFNIPEKSVYTYIGQGLNGEIFGSVARIDNFTLADYELKKPIAAFPDSTAISLIIASNERDGTIGSEMLRRFHIILDYHDTLMYVKRNSSLRQKFSYNTTGIEVVQPYQKLPVFEIAELWDKSPAAQAGLRIGDRIESVDYRSVNELSLIEVKELLRKTSGKIRLIISRKDGDELIRKKVKFDVFRL